MTILLTHGYFIAEDEREQAIMKPYPPLGILGIAAFLREHGRTPEVFDSTFSSADALIARITATRPDILGIYTNLMTRPRIVELIARIRADHALNGTRIVLGGPEITHHVERFLAHGADILVIGEGEETMLELVEALESGRPLEEVHGIAFRDDEGRTITTPPRALVRSLDTLPRPARDLIDIDAYQNAWRGRHGRSAVSVSTMRGCPYSCRWCSRAVYGSSYRRRSPAVVVEEILHIRETYRPDSLWFVDDVFTISPVWMRGFAEEIVRRDAVVPYECITRADRLNLEMIELLVRSGCYRVWIGAESGSQKILDAMDRRVTVEQVREMMRLGREHGLETGTFIMLGYPGETEEDIIETIEHLKACRPDHFTVTTAYPIAGTPLYQEVESDIVAPPPWEASTDRDLTFTRPYSETYYRHALRRLYSEVALDRLEREGGSLIDRSLLAMKITVSRVGMRMARR